MTEWERRRKDSGRDGRWNMMREKMKEKIEGTNE